MLKSRTPCSISVRWSTSTRLPNPGHGLPCTCAWACGIGVAGIGVGEELGGLAVTRPGTVVLPVGAGAALLARIGGGTPSWIFFSVAETKLASVNGERSSGFSRYCSVSLTTKRSAAPAQVRAFNAPRSTFAATRGKRGTTHALDSLVRRLHPATLPDDLVAPERVEHPRVKDTKHDRVDAHEQPREDEERVRHYPHAHVELGAAVVVQLVFVQWHVVVEQDPVQDWVLAG